MLETNGRLHLATEALDEGRVVLDVGEHELERDDLARRAIGRLVHRGHAALPKDSANLKVGERYVCHVRR